MADRALIDAAIRAAEEWQERAGSDVGWDAYAEAILAVVEPMIRQDERASNARDADAIVLAVHAEHADDRQWAQWQVACNTIGARQRAKFAEAHRG